MRARWLKPEFFTDRKMSDAGPITALVYAALWCMADDGGTVECDADIVKAKMFFRWSAVGVPEIIEALRHLAHTSRIVRYRVGDETFATIESWNEHQKVHKPSAFRRPVAAQGVAVPLEEVSAECHTSAALVTGTPLLDTKTPRHLDTERASAARKRASAPWVSAGVALWLPLVGTITPKRFSSCLGPLVELHGWDVVWSDLAKWVTERRDEGKPVKLEWYAESASARIAFVEPAIVDEFGCLTVYGERVTRP